MRVNAWRRQTHECTATSHYVSDRFRNLHMGCRRWRNQLCHFFRKSPLVSELWDRERWPFHWKHFSPL